MNRTDLNRNDFQLCNEWVIDVDGEKGGELPKYVTDQTTGFRYYNDPELKHRMFELATFDCFLNAITLTVFATGRVFRVLCCYPFWPCRSEQRYEPLDKGEGDIVMVDLISAEDALDEVEPSCKKPCTDRVKEVAADILKLVTTPLSFLATGMAACYGMCSPNNGRKLSISLARWQYGNSLPSFYKPLVRHSDLPVTTWTWM